MRLLPATLGPRVCRVTRLDRYMFRQLPLALIAVTGGLVALIWLTQSLRFVELVVNRGLSLRVFLELTGLLIPNFVAVILPITTFVVVQFVYQRLAGDRELTVMRAAGLSPLALARPALGLALVAMVACYILNLWLVPASYAPSGNIQFEIRNRIAAFLLQEGVFTPVSDDLTVYVRTRDPDGTLHGILVEDARQEEQPRHHPGRARPAGRHGRTRRAVLLLNGSRQEMDQQTGRLNVLTFAQNAIDLAQRPATATSSGFATRPRCRWPSCCNPAPGAGDRARHRASCWWRRTGGCRRRSPPSRFAMVALVAVLTGAFRRHGNMLRPLVAVLTRGRPCWRRAGGRQSGQRGSRC